MSNQAASFNALSINRAKKVKVKFIHTYLLYWN